MLKTLPLTLLLCSCAFAADVMYLPVNVIHEDGEEVDGLVFFFGEPTAPEAVITVTALQDDKPVTSTQTLDTDRVHGERLVFNLVIDEAHRHELVHMTVTVGGVTYTFWRPRSGVIYALAPLKKHSH